MYMCMYVYVWPHSQLVFMVSDEKYAVDLIKDPLCMTGHLSLDAFKNFYLSSACNSFIIRLTVNLFACVLLVVC